jgi:hypothetical protein
MRVELDGQDLEVERFETFDALVEAYRSDELHEGRTVPAHALEALLVGLALWLVQTAAEKVIDEVLARRREKNDDTKAELQALRDEVRALRAELSDDASGPRLRSGARLTIVLETDAEADVAPTLERLLGDGRVTDGRSGDDVTE